MRAMPHLLLWALALGGATASGQYGLQGAPEPLRLAQTQSVYSNPYSTIGPLPVASPAPMAQTVPAGPMLTRPATSAGSTLVMPSGTMTPTYVAAPTPMAVAAVQPYYTPVSGPVPGVAPGQPVMIQAVPPSNVYVSAPTGSAPAGSAPSGGVVDQMLQEAGRGKLATGGACPGACGAPGPVNGGCWQSSSLGGCATECGEAAPCLWFGSALFLYMGRNNGNRLWTSYESGNPPNQIMHSDYNTAWQPGGEITVGRRFGCGTWAVAGTYWALGQFEGSRDISMPGGVSTPLAVDGIEFAGTNGTAYFDNAAAHELHRKSDIQNIEINTILGGGCCQNCGGFQWNVLAGFRYLQFNDEFDFISLRNGGSWGTPADEAYLADRVDNNLYGGQIGFDGAYCLAPNFRLFFGGKVGLYDNHMEGRFSAFRGDNVTANPTAASGMVGTYPVTGSKDVLAVLSELSTGVQWDVTRHVGVQVGYRLVSVSGVAMAEHQFPHYIVDIPEIQNIKSNGNLILHGAFAGLTFNW